MRVDLEVRPAVSCKATTSRLVNSGSSGEGRLTFTERRGRNAPPNKDDSAELKGLRLLFAYMSH